MNLTSDRFSPTPLPDLLQIILNQYDRTQSIFGIPEALFFRPSLSDPFRMTRFGQLLETPFGLAAGPHTQLSQNILAGWLTGARFIELKTVQTLDELEISKPCIDMQDEGYNCEWSQELKIEDSFGQYLDAWVLIHVLKDKLSIGNPSMPGFIFNMSVGYDFQGIQQDNVQWFFEKMQDASHELGLKIEELAKLYPRVKDLKISPFLSDNITLSTMHGCPPHEIEQIGAYLLREKKLHTTIKLNPTLLGQEALNQTMKRSGFGTSVPDEAFAHDLRFDDAVKIIKRLSAIADDQKLHFGVKLTNTLESRNNKEVFPPNEKMMYMSGRALHPLSVQIANKLQQAFDGSLAVSFCGGADAFNIPDLVACGLAPVTVCTDLLKPGGYGRQHQYVEELGMAFDRAQASDIPTFIKRTAGDNAATLAGAAIHNLRQYAELVVNASDYQKNDFYEPSIKTSKKLGWFDCTFAPCQHTCPTGQDIPNYNYFSSKRNFDKAAEVIRDTNPFPLTTGMICDHTCQLKCTRINYDHPVLIREVKRFVAEYAAGKQENAKNGEAKAKSVAVIGAGPSGLSCAAFLARAGFVVEVFEAKSRPGGMVSSGIPAFRLTDKALLADVEAVESLGVKINYNASVDESNFKQLRNRFGYIYIGAGAQRSAQLGIEGINAAGVLDPLLLLETIREGSESQLGKNVVIIGGGNTAMDVARTAYRMVGYQGRVSIVYRRNIRQMPADLGEIKAVLAEGMEIIELAAPLKVNTTDGKVKSLSCVRMQLGPKDASGRPRPVEVSGSEFEIEADTIIPAVGQELAIDFCDISLLKTKDDSYETLIPNVFIGGDAMRGASTAINAIGDGRKAAQEIIKREGVDYQTMTTFERPEMDSTQHMVMRAKRIQAVKVKETPLNDRKNFKLVASAINQDEAVHEASRCLLCDEMCNSCITVCPNLAFHFYKTKAVSYISGRLLIENGKWELLDPEPFVIKQKYQQLHIADWCNHCGNCNTFCPTADAPYKVKPHLFIDRNAWQESEEGYWLERNNGVAVLHQKHADGPVSLEEQSDSYMFVSHGMRIRLNKTDLAVMEVSAESSKTETHLGQAIAMHQILRAAKSFFGI